MFVPKIIDKVSIEIKNGRHPIIEKSLPIGERYIPNNIILDKDNQQILMITGPNMSGKSAVLRQNSLNCDSCANWLFCSCRKS